jgi:glycosyltransferase involved in cell wall biosynthesis
VEFLLAGGARVERNKQYMAKIQESAPSNLSVTGVLDDDRFQAAIAAADIIILPYESVTQSGVLNWCAAYRTPVITTPLGHFRDLATDFDYPALFESDDIGVMADGVRELLADGSRRSRLRDRAAEFHRTNRSDQVVEDHVQIYRDIVNEK